MGNCWMQSVPSPERKNILQKEKVYPGAVPLGRQEGTKGNGRIRNQLLPQSVSKSHYPVKEKADYPKKKAGPRRVKKEGSVIPAGEVKHTVWAEAHKGVNQKVFDELKNENECARCGMKNNAWKYCRKQVQVAAVYRGQLKPQ